MTKARIIYLASLALAKSWDFEDLKYSEELCNNEEYLDEIWGYVEEGRYNGSVSFYSKYCCYELFPVY